uniref:MD-2-related lipid-recognition domain-containing protein n=1 Tax=Glossina palpalis gambiensis TaxID=67801 RepID=A0A1B0BU24_9MUSC
MKPNFPRNTMSSLDILLVIFLSILTTVQPALYRFIPEVSDVFMDCADRPEMSGVDIELKKYARGSWHQTFLSVKVIDLCKQMRNTNSIVYDSWSTHIILEEGEEFPCFGKGVKYLHEAFVVKAEGDVIGMNMEGRHKLVFIFHAYDKNNQRKPNSICVEIPGEILKV